MPGSGEENTSKHREIILRLKAPENGSSLKMISHLNPLYSPLHYVLLFPFGDLGWHDNISTIPGEHGKVYAKHVTQRRYYAHRLHTRPEEPLTLFYGGKLFQQYVVDAWSSIEDSELYWLRNN